MEELAVGDGVLRSLDLESRATVARFSEPRERSDLVSIETCCLTWLNGGVWRPGMVRFGLSTWKVEQLWLGSPNRGNGATWSPLRLAV